MQSAVVVLGPTHTLFLRSLKSASLLILTLLIAISCSKQDLQSTPPTPACDDAIDTAALRSLPAEIIFGESNGRKEIQRIRLWAETLPNSCVRRAYLHWLDFYEKDFNKRDHVDAIAREIPKPPSAEVQP
jgi:hypothetical protein